MGVDVLTVVGRYVAHAAVLLIAVVLSGYATAGRDLPAAARLRLGVVNAEGLALGQGGTAGGVALGRAGTIVKPVAVATSPPVIHRPTFYSVLEGEDVRAVAAKFNLSADQLRWSNAALQSTDRMAAGDRLAIPPVPGVVVTVREGDTAASIAGAYHADVQTVVDFNYLRSPDQLTPGDLLVVPDGRGPELWPRRASDDPPHLGAFAKERFAYGYCTWYVASRRQVPWSGDAAAWFANARAMGFATGRLPQPGAIMVTSESWVGHVAYVEQVNADGSFVVSEMNYQGWGVISTRALASPAAVPLIGFIY